MIFDELRINLSCYLFLVVISGLASATRKAFIVLLGSLYYESFLISAGMNNFIEDVRSLLVNFPFLIDN